MDTLQLQQLIAQHIKDAVVTVTGGSGKFEATVISDIFSNLTTLKRHKAVYAAINSHITDGSIHAVSIRAYTVAEHENQKPEETHLPVTD